MALSPDAKALHERLLASYLDQLASAEVQLIAIERRIKDATTAIANQRAIIEAGEAD